MTHKRMWVYSYRKIFLGFISSSNFNTLVVWVILEYSYSSCGEIEGCFHYLSPMSWPLQHSRKRSIPNSLILIFRTIKLGTFNVILYFQKENNKTEYFHIRRNKMSPKLNTSKMFEGHKRGKRHVTQNHKI